MDFRGRTVIVTGAGGGIGEAYARGCAAAGMNVVVADIDEAAGGRVAEEIRRAGGRALFVATDVASERSAQACVAAATAAFGEIDYLVNNAAIFGGMRAESYLTVDLDYLERFMRVNMHGCLIMARAAVPSMERKGGGAIVNQSSTAAWMAAGYYGVAKLAVNGITQSLARELGPRNIRVNAIAPGPTDTPAMRRQASAPGGGFAADHASRPPRHARRPGGSAALSALRRGALDHRPHPQRGRRPADAPLILGGGSAFR
ncbi:MAG: hypothetical protein KatS3mg124_1206 [Porticoccaceae bacterium]|nr:MAG: hypothetical protein KatS3mg124_1206 [Porticoccaceae bacterium]